MHLVGLGSRVNLGREHIGFKGKRSWRMKTEECSSGVEQEHMVMSGGNGGAEEVGDNR